MQQRILHQQQGMMIFHPKNEIQITICTLFLMTKPVT